MLDIVGHVEDILFRTRICFGRGYGWINMVGYGWILDMVDIWLCISWIHISCAPEKCDEFPGQAIPLTYHSPLLTEQKK